MDATNRAGQQWHPGNEPVLVEFNGHDGSLVN